MSKQEEQDTVPAASGSACANPAHDNGKTNAQDDPKASSPAALAKSDSPLSSPVPSLTAHASGSSGDVGSAKANDLGVGLARSLAWIILVLTLASGLALAIFIGNSARDILLKKQQGFASLLAENLNQQIYRNFTLPTVLGFGRIALRQPVQYERLEQVVQSTIQGMHVHSLRILDHNQVVTFSTNKSELGSSIFSTASTTLAQTVDNPIFNIDSSVPFWQALFLPHLEKGSFFLRTTYPMRIENRLSSSGQEGPVMGILEFSQDITNDMEIVVRFQRLIIGVALVSSTMLFVLLLIFIRRAERAMAARVQERQRLLMELHQSEKLASMGRVVASIAHEIRNPLGIICSTTEFLLKRPAGQEPLTARFLTAINDEAVRLSRIVSDFLDYAKPRQPAKSLVDICVVLEQALTFLGPELVKNSVEIIRQCPDSGLFVRGDKNLIYRAVYNVISNSIQALDGGGHISIVARQADDNVLVEFVDSGPGFSAEVLPHLLDPFFTTKDEGTGLGLPIVNSIITSHGGNLVLANSPDGGALITVSLPCAHDKE